MTTPPGVTVTGDALFVIDRSALRVTSVDSGAVLSVGSGSDVDDVTRATFVSEPAVESGGTGVRTVTVTVAPATIVPTEHDNGTTLTMQTPCEGVAVTPPTPPGRSSVTKTSVAALGPALVTVIVEVTMPPATTVVGELTFVTDQVG